MVDRHNVVCPKKLWARWVNRPAKAQDLNNSQYIRKVLAEAYVKRTKKKGGGT